MPSLIIRQWRLWRQGLAAAGKINSSGRHPREAFRQYSQETKVEDASLPSVEPIEGAIVIPHSISSTQPKHIIACFSPIPLNSFPQRSFCVLLATPSFASWFLDNEIFVKGALNRLYGEGMLSTERNNQLAYDINVLCGVVDKLPIGKSVRDGATLEDELRFRTLHPRIGGNGAEGIAYAALPATASVISGTAISGDEDGIIDFITKPRETNENLISSAVSVPLANTVFQIGVRTTMMYSTWKLDGNTNDLKCASSKKVSRHGVCLNSNDEVGSEVHSALSVPLIPLTVPRRAIEYMGNIIRQLEGPGEAKLTASFELEEAVPVYFEAREENAHSTTVWALVIPGHMADDLLHETNALLAKGRPDFEAGYPPTSRTWQYLWQSNPPLWSDMIPKALQSTARLHRVLSGGGGWGKKAGLISLDPAPSHEDAFGLNKTNEQDILNEPTDFASSLVPVVREGDYIQFFISPNSRSGSVPHQPNTLKAIRNLTARQNFGWEFGTIPSTIDIMPGQSWQHADQSSVEVSVLSNTFGALTEKRLLLSRQYADEDVETERQSQVRVVDVPFSRFWAMSTKGQNGAGSVLLRSSQVQKRLPKVSIGIRPRRVLVSAMSIESISSLVTVTQADSSVPSTVTMTPDAMRRAKGRIRKRINEIKSSIAELNSISASSVPSRFEVTKDVGSSSTEDFAWKLRYIPLRESQPDLEPHRDERPPSRSEAGISSRTSTTVSSTPIRDHDKNKDLSSRTTDRRLQRIAKRVKDFKAQCQIITFNARWQVQALKFRREASVNQSSRISPLSSATDDQLINEFPRLNVELLTRRLRRIRRKINQLVKEYWAVKFTIRRRQRRLKDADPNANVEVVRSLPRNTLEGNLVHLLQRSVKILDRLRYIFYLIIGNRRLRDFPDPLLSQLTSIQQITADSFTDLAKIMHVVSRRAHIIHRTNSYGLAVYRLHTQLRWHIGRMIRTRLLSITLLEEHLKLRAQLEQLRHFNVNLLINRSGVTEEDVRIFLEGRELKSAAQRRILVRLDKSTMGKNLTRRECIQLLRNMRKRVPVVVGSNVRKTVIAPRAKRSMAITRYQSLPPSSINVVRRADKWRKVPGRSAPRRVRSKTSPRTMYRTETQRKRDVLVAQVESWLKGTFVPGARDSVGHGRQRVFGERRSVSKWYVDGDIKVGQAKGEDSLSMLLATAERHDANKR